MKLFAIRRLEFDRLDSDYDLIVAATGYESRARHVAEQLQSTQNRTGVRVVLAFSEHRTQCARAENDKVFASFGYQSKICRGSSPEDASSVFLDAIAQVPSAASIKILVDVSSMTRAWYGAIIRALTQKTGTSEFVVHFAYTPSQFIPPSDAYPPNRIVGPISGFTGNTLPDKPTALIIGLGYDRDRARGLKDYLDPQLTFLFSANPSTDTRFVQNVREVNKDLYSELPEDHAFSYPVNDPVATFKLIESVSNGLRHDWRVVLCSLGPKTFGLCCFLVASLYRDLSIWRVGADHHEKPSDHQPGGPTVVLETAWR